MPLRPFCACEMTCGATNRVSVSIDTRLGIIVGEHGYRFTADECHVVMRCSNGHRSHFKIGWSLGGMLPVTRWQSLEPALDGGVKGRSGMGVPAVLAELLLPRADRSTGLGISRETTRIAASSPTGREHRRNDPLDSAPCPALAPSSGRAPPCQPDRQARASLPTRHVSRSP